jgi:SAM-dependent methyltransferase/uncharacterized protein YbaR (Trm112 family)
MSICESYNDLLICPSTKLPLHAMSLEEAQFSLRSKDLVPRKNKQPAPFGVTAELMVRSDHMCAYPVVAGIPLVLAPEQITAEQYARSFDLQDQRYAEAYEEMAHYNQTAEAEAKEIRMSESYRAIEPVLLLPPNERDSFPDPKHIWIDSVYDCMAQHEAYLHLSPVAGKRVLQLGGKGIHAVKCLLAGASEAWILTPMLGEIYCAIALAKEAGVLDQLRCVAGVAEEIPIANNTFDIILSGGCVHHMNTELSFPEVARVLRTGGRFACWDPWRAPLHALGTKLLGKREANVYCHPLTPERVEPLFRSFTGARRSQYGTLTRYPALALLKFGLRLPFSALWKIYCVDDAICSLLRCRGYGSSVALFATK